MRADNQQKKSQCQHGGRKRNKRPYSGNFREKTFETRNAVLLPTSLIEQTRQDREVAYPSKMRDRWSTSNHEASAWTIARWWCNTRIVHMGLGRAKSQANVEPDQALEWETAQEDPMLTQANVCEEGSCHDTCGYISDHGGQHKTNRR
nr:hypothetical protein Iba_chr14dCG16120 [Ipomoea batatas]